MRVLVTGSDGYIGAVLIERLRRRGHEVGGLDTGYYRTGKLFPPRTSVPTLRKDIRDIEAEDLAGFDAVVHMAELSNDPLGAHNPQITRAINHGGSLRMANAARRAGVRRFVYTSSCSVYGAAEIEGDGYVDETTPPNPQTAYAECKVDVERDLSAMAGDDFEACFLRNATAFGASPRMRFDIVLNNLTGVAWTTNEIKLLSDGTPWRPLVHVEDICQAIELSLKAPAVDIQAQIFNVGSTEQNYRIIELADIVAREVPRCTLSIGEADPDNRSYRVDFAKIGRVLPKFRCAWTAERGAAQLVDLYRQIGLKRADFDAAPFTRLKMLTSLRETGALDASLQWRARDAA